jgi:hypothetical protein
MIYLILFYLVANPATFKMVRKVLGSWVSSAEGLPTSAGLLLHAVVYVTLACYLPAKIVSTYAPAPAPGTAMMASGPTVDPVAQAQMDAQSAQLSADKANAKLAAANAYVTSLKSSMSVQTAPVTVSKYANDPEGYED